MVCCIVIDNQNSALQEPQALEHCEAARAWELEVLDSGHSSVPNELCDLGHSVLSLWASTSSLV